MEIFETTKRHRRSNSSSNTSRSILPHVVTRRALVVGITSLFWVLAVKPTFVGVTPSIHASARTPLSRVARHALSEVGKVGLILKGGKATPAPPVGPALGKFGANIGMFVKEYNALTSGPDSLGVVIPCVVHFFSDRSFKIEIKRPPTSFLILKAAQTPKSSRQPHAGSPMPKHNIVGTITIDQLRAIAIKKLPDMTSHDVERAMKVIHGTTRAVGVNVEGYQEWLATANKRPVGILNRYGIRLSQMPSSPEIDLQRAREAAEKTG